MITLTELIHKLEENILPPKRDPSEYGIIYRVSDVDIGKTCPEMRAYRVLGIFCSRANAPVSTLVRLQCHVDVFDIDLDEALREFYTEYDEALTECWQKNIQWIDATVKTLLADKEDYKRRLQK